MTRRSRQLGPAPSTLLSPPVRRLCRLLRVDPAPFARRLRPRVAATARLPDGTVVRLRSRGDEDSANLLFWYGTAGIEAETASMFYALARDAAIVLDVGAHVGYFSILAALANPNARVVAFEPLPMALERLRENLVLNGVANVEAVALAAGDSDDTAAFYYGDLGVIPTNSGLSRRFTGAWNVPLREIEVRVVVLDRWLREGGLDGVDLVKIDVEGAELQALKGMRKVLAERQPHLFCEVLVPPADAAEITALVRQFGYRIYYLTGAGPVPQDDAVRRGPWRNFLFTTEPPERVSGWWQSRRGGPWTNEQDPKVRP